MVVAAGAIDRYQTEKEGRCSFILSFSLERDHEATSAGNCTVLLFRQLDTRVDTSSNHSIDER